MFLANSWARAEASLPCLRCANISSLVFLPCMAPLDKVSLSGTRAVALLSSVRVCTLPLALRCAPACSASGAAPARRRRKALKSRLCTAINWRAWPAGVAKASSWLGICKTEPAFRRLTLPCTKALGLARDMATSIWSSDTPCWRRALAMRPAVSPGVTRTVSSALAWLVEARGAAAARRWLAEEPALRSLLSLLPLAAVLLSSTGTARRRLGGTATLLAGAEREGATTAAAACERRGAGGSNSMV